MSALKRLPIRVFLATVVAVLGLGMLALPVQANHVPCYPPPPPGQSCGAHPTPTPTVSPTRSPRPTPSPIPSAEPTQTPTPAVPTPAPGPAPSEGGPGGGGNPGGGNPGGGNPGGGNPGGGNPGGGNPSDPTGNNPVPVDLGNGGSISDVQPNIGEPVTFVIGGAQPNSIVEFFLFSTPRKLGEARANANGVARLTARIPADVPPGSHTFVIKGTSADGTPLEISQPVTVLPVAAPAPAAGPLPGGSGSGGGAEAGGLARTGIPLTNGLALAALMIFAGLGALLLARRRKPTTDQRTQTS